jgi:phosphate-selective porin OprO/OprP
MKFTPSALLLTAGFAFSTLFSCGSAQAAVERPEETITESNPRSIYDKIWDSSTLYKADSGFLTELALQGRLHIQDAQGWSNQGNFGSRDRPQSVRWGDWEVRRLRLGAKAKLFDGNAKLDGHIDVNPNFNQFYGRIYEVFFEYTLSNALTIGFGKKKAFFSLEHSISSKEIITLERALLTNALFTGQYTGIWASGKVGNLLWDTGLYAGDDEREFTTFNGGAIFQAGLAYDLAEATGFDRASINFDYQKATADTTVNNGNLAGAPVPYLFESAMSLNSTWEKGRWAFYTDTLAGHGRGTQGDVFGVVLMPSVYVATGLQLVSRYQYAAGQDNGLRLASRYDRLAPYTTNGGRGDVYHAFYVGANYYIYGNKLKLMTGLEYSTMSGCNYAGWTWSGGLRMFF